MGIFLTLIAGLVLWIVLWGTSLMKSFDAFLIAMLVPASGGHRSHRDQVPAARQRLSARCPRAKRPSGPARSAGLRSTLLHALTGQA
jgi:hypothetical protein